VFCVYSRIQKFARLGLKKSIDLHLLLAKLRENGIRVVPVPISYKDRLQPLDLGIDVLFKQSLKSLFEDFYSGLVSEQLKTNCIKDVQVDKCLSKIKPLHAQRDELTQKPEIIKHSWVIADIV
jgi:hypothetical protein